MQLLSIYFKDMRGKRSLGNKVEVIWRGAKELSAFSVLRFAAPIFWDGAIMPAEDSIRYGRAALTSEFYAKDANLL